MPSTNSRRPVVLLLSAIAALLVANLIVQIAGQREPMRLVPAAHAGGDILMGDAPGAYLYTTNDNGDRLYIWKRTTDRKYECEVFESR